MVITDSGYGDVRCIAPPPSHHPLARLFSLVRARHETANGRLNQFSVLAKRFRHDISTHSACFFAVLNVTNIALEEQPLFQIKF